ncbi:MAG: hypothetical protein K2I92_08095, partial [Muribaculaceae bacterium]|nr:hypothetical protein [Muribaculaceae bacterium]
MKDKVKYSLPVQVRMLLKAGRYKDCFMLLRRRLTEVPVQGALNRVSQAESTYRYMLEYFARGLADPGRDEMLASLRHELLDIAQKIDKDMSATDSPELYFSTLRLCRLRPSSLQESVDRIVELKAMADLALGAGEYPDSVMPQIESEEEKVFNILWTSDSLRSDEYSAMENAALNASVPFSTVSLAISATGLSLMRYYSLDAFMFLIALAKAPDLRISARALSALILALSRWQEAVADDNRLIQALQSLTYIDGMQEKIRKTVKTTIRTRDTDRVSRKMQRDVIPGLMQ